MCPVAVFEHLRRSEGGVWQPRPDAEVFPMKRRDFLSSAGVTTVGLAFSRATSLFARAESSGNWRTFEVTTRIEILKPSGLTRIWVPAGLLDETPFQKTLANTFHVDEGTARVVESKADSLAFVSAEFPAGAKPLLT